MRFGTDGIRGNSKTLVTPELAYSFGAAFAEYRLLHNPNAVIAIGRDTRESGLALEESIVRGISEAGGDSIIAGVMPTPALSQFITEKYLSGGIMITASHNPPEDNGLKPLNSLGKKLSFEDRIGIENLFDKNPKKNKILGSFYEISSGWIPWMTKIWSYIRISGKENSLTGEKIVVDSANGAARLLAAQALSPFGAKIIQIGNGDGDKINLGCGSLHPERMVELVKSSGAIAGIALDGDGDRVQVCDGEGNLYDGDDILWMLRENSKIIVGTIMTNDGLARSLKKEGSMLYRAAVGDANVAEAMRNYWSPIGGEPSGHILFDDGMPTSCGTFTAAKLLAKGPREWLKLTSDLRKTYQASSNIPLQETEIFDDTVKILERNGIRAVIRASGTEPVIRIMTEAETKEDADNSLKILLQMSIK
jgi:phosphoglucosamine mutase